MLNSIVLSYSTLRCTSPCYPILYYTMLCYTVLYKALLCYIILHYHRAAKIETSSKGWNKTNVGVVWKSGSGGQAAQFETSSQDLDKELVCLGRLYRFGKSWSGSQAINQEISFQGFDTQIVGLGRPNQTVEIWVWRPGS